VKTVGERWTTSLTTAELGMIFRSTSLEIFGTGPRQLLSAVKGPGTAGRLEFFTPKDSPNDIPFAQLVPQPALKVGVQGPQGGFVNGAVPITIQMYVFAGETIRASNL